MAFTLDVPVDTHLISVMVEGLIKTHLSGSKDPRLTTPAAQPAPTPESPVVPARTPPEEGEPYPWMLPRPEVVRAPREFAEVSDDETEDLYTSQESLLSE